MGICGIPVMHVAWRHRSLWAEFIWHHLHVDLPFTLSSKINTLKWNTILLIELHISHSHVLYFNLYSSGAWICNIIYSTVTVHKREMGLRWYVWYYHSDVIVWETWSSATFRHVQWINSRYFHYNAWFSRVRYTYMQAPHWFCHYDLNYMPPLDSTVSVKVYIAFTLRVMCIRKTPIGFDYESL